MKLLAKDSKLKTGDLLIIKEGIEIPEEKLAILNAVDSLIVSKTGNSVIQFEGCGEEVFSKKHFIKKVSLGITFNFSKEQIDDRRIILHVKSPNGNIREVNRKSLIKIENNVFFTEDEAIPLNDIHHLMSRVSTNDKVIIPPSMVGKVTTDQSRNTVNQNYDPSLFPNSVVKGKIIRLLASSGKYLIKLESQGYALLSSNYFYLYSAGKIRPALAVSDKVMVKKDKLTGVISELRKTSSCTYAKIKMDNGETKVLDVKKIKQLK